jgi:sodium transport system permease protein
MVPLVTVFNQEGEAPWHRFVPALAQVALMGRVLKGESLTFGQVAVPVVVCAVLAIACIAFVARALKSAALK